MRLKLLISSLIVLSFYFKSFGQILPTLTGWQVEKFSLPPEFASTLPFKGTEDIRFSPEWSKKHTDGYWTYCFLWTINANRAFTITDLQQYLHDYYKGLIRSNLIKMKIDTSIAKPVKVSLHKIAGNNTDKSAFEGQVEMLDYITQDPITLNFRARIKKQSSNSNTSILYFEASPQPYSHKLWSEMDNMGKQVK